MFKISQAFFALPADVKARYGFDQVQSVPMCYCSTHTAPFSQRTACRARTWAGRAGARSAPRTPCPS